jgi:uncharacterized protein YraI
MKTALARLALLAALLVAAAAPAVAFEAAEVTADLHMRAGPGTSYRVLGTIPRGSRVVVHSCAAGGRWCDTSWRDERGWVWSAYLSTYAVSDESGLPIVTYEIGPYWDSYYGDYWWYRGGYNYNPAERHRDEYGSSWWYQNR